MMQSGKKPVLQGNPGLGPKDNRQARLTLRPSACRPRGVVLNGLTRIDFDYGERKLFDFD